MKRKRNTKPGEIPMPVEAKSEFTRVRINPSKYNRRNLIFRLASVCCSEEDIAFVLDLPRSQVSAFRPLIAKGRAHMRTALKHKQFQVAMRGNPSMLIFLGKNYLGQREDPGASDETKGALQDLIKALRSGPVSDEEAEGEE